MLFPCSCDVYVRPGQLRVVLANKIDVRFQTQKIRLNHKILKDIDILVRFEVPVLWKVIIVSDRRNRNGSDPTIIGSSHTPIIPKNFQPLRNALKKTFLARCWAKIGLRKSKPIFVYLNRRDSGPRQASIDKSTTMS